MQVGPIVLIHLLWVINNFIWVCFWVACHCNAKVGCVRLPAGKNRKQLIMQSSCKGCCTKPGSSNGSYEEGIAACAITPDVFDKIQGTRKASLHSLESFLTLGGISTQRKDVLNA